MNLRDLFFTLKAGTGMNLPHWSKPTCVEDARKTVLCPACFRVWTFKVNPLLLDIHCDYHHGYKVKTMLLESEREARDAVNGLMNAFPQKPGDFLIIDPHPPYEAKA